MKKNALFLSGLAVSALLHLLLFLMVPVIGQRSAEWQPVVDTYAVSLLFAIPVQEPSPVPAAKQERSKPSEEPLPRDEPASVREPESAVQRETAESDIGTIKNANEPPAKPVTETLHERGEPARAEQSQGNESRGQDSASSRVASGPAASGSAVFEQTPAYQRAIAGLRRRIIAAITYPAAARTQGLKGEVVLLVRLDADGLLQDLVIKRTSGHPVLDRAAAALIRKITPYQHHLGRPLSLEIPIVYELKE